MPGFSALVAAAEKGRPKLVSRHGKPCAMIVPVADKARLYPLEQPNFADYPFVIARFIPPGGFGALRSKTDSFQANPSRRWLLLRGAGAFGAKVRLPLRSKAL